MTQFVQSALRDELSAELAAHMLAMHRRGMPADAFVIVEALPERRYGHPPVLSLRGEWDLPTDNLTIREAEQEARILASEHAHEHYAQVFEGMARMGPVELEQFVKRYVREPGNRSVMRTGAILR